MDKVEAELKFWKEEIHYYLGWFAGAHQNLYGIQCPDNLRYPDSPNDVAEAIRVWTFADRYRYCKHLLVPPDYWECLKGIEIGCGPLGLGRWFTDSNVIGIDPLRDKYEELGYPVYTTKSYRTLRASAENLPFQNHSCDFAYSVNAIDHVDNFEAAVEELERVVDPMGEIRIEVHYHEATVTEPIVLNDERVKAAFKKFDMKKISELPSTAFYPAGTHPVTDRFALWSNKDFKWEGALNL